jgi:hypothetical protein
VIYRIMDISFTLDDADSAILRNFTRRRVDVRNAGRTAWQPLAVLAAFGGILTIVLDGGESHLVELQLILFSCCLGIAGALTVFAVARRINRTMQPELPPGHYTVRLTDEGLEIMGETAARLVRWSRVASVQQDMAAIFVFESHAVGYIVPRRAFVDAAAANSFFNVARVYAQRAQPAMHHVRSEELAGMLTSDQTTAPSAPSRFSKSDAWTEVRESA